MTLKLATKKELPARNYVSTAYDFEIPLRERAFYSKKEEVLSYSVNQLVREKIICFDRANVERSIAQYKTIEEKIIGIFQHDQVISGEKKHIEDTRQFFVSRLRSQIRTRKPITFTLLQFPFKIPNPLKTERVLPDLGELAYLSQLNQIAECIKTVYPPGAKFIILGESLVFRDITDTSLGEALSYRTISEWWIKKLNFQKTIELVELRTAEKKIPHFSDEFEKHLTLLRKKYSARDKETIDSVSAVLPTLFFCLNVRGISRQTLMNVYDSHRQTKDLTKDETEIREELKKTSQDIALRYLAYHLCVKTTKLREKLWPNSIGVSPIAKPNRFGVFPCSNKNKLYTIHGVPVYDRNGYITVHYKIDVLRNKNIPYAYKVAYGNIQEEKELDPFFYSEVRL